MVYTRKSPALFVIGLIMLGIWGLQEAGILSAYLAHLGGAKYKYAGEIATVPLYFGIFSVAAGAWQWLGRHREGQFDYYLSTAGRRHVYPLDCDAGPMVCSPGNCCWQQGAR